MKFLTLSISTYISGLVDVEIDFFYFVLKLVILVEIEPEIFLVKVIFM